MLDKDLPLGQAGLGRSSRRSVVVVVVVSIVVVSILTIAGWMRMQHSVSGPPQVVLPSTKYPVGIASAGEPSGVAPPSPSAIPGYRQSYVSDFRGKTLPKGWLTFNGVPGGDPGAQFDPEHVVVRNGQLLLLTYRDKHYQKRWVTGGLCQCGLPAVYGAYFVRSRATAVGPNEVELLWPADDKWPPEIDFNESPSAHQTSATVHWGGANNTQQWLLHDVNMMAWHTWGVVWTPHEISYVVDGRVWGIITNPAAIPRVPLVLDLEQRTSCSIHAQCPTAPVQMQVDWIAEYRAT